MKIWKSERDTSNGSRALNFQVHLHVIETRAGGALIFESFLTGRSLNAFVTTIISLLFGVETGLRRFGKKWRETFFFALFIPFG